MHSGDSTLGVTRVYRRGDLAGEILKAAEEHRADLIIRGIFFNAGSHRRTATMTYADFAGLVRPAVGAFATEPVAV